MRIISKLTFLIFLFQIITSTSSVIALETITIDRGIAEPLPVAMPDFFSSGERKDNGEDLETVIVDVISNDLESTGFFRKIDKEAYLDTDPSAHLNPRFPDWKLINAEALITGNVHYGENNKINVAFRLWDVYGQKEMLGLMLSTVSTNWRRVAHKISDQIYEKLTGDTGYFDTRIIYVSETGPKNARVKKLAIMDQDGANVEYLTSGNELVLTPRFSPTELKVTYLSYFKDVPRVYLLDVQTGKQEIVGDFPGMTFAPRFSPDGKKVIMSLARDGNSDIYSMHIETRVVERLTNHPAIDTSPSYSPDGKYIAFNSDRGGSQQIYVMQSNGRGHKRISFGKGNYGTPVWSPRGDLVAFTKIYKGQFYIGVMRVDGSGERLLTDSFYQEAPTWSPNGRILMFYRETRSGEGGEGHSSRLWSIDLTGENEKQIMTETDASDPSWSPTLN